MSHAHLRIDFRRQPVTILPSKLALIIIPQKLRQRAKLPHRTLAMARPRVSPHSNEWAHDSKRTPQRQHLAKVLAGSGAQRVRQKRNRTLDNNNNWAQLCCVYKSLFSGHQARASKFKLVPLGPAPIELIGQQHHAFCHGLRVQSNERALCCSEC